jgi:hypothetical protein
LVAKVKEKKMADKRFWIGMLVMVFGMLVVGCSDDPTINDETGGIFILTDIPVTYNGKYGYLEASNPNISLIGCESLNIPMEAINLVQISNGRISLPMWIDNNYTSETRYTGNDTFTEDDFVRISICNKATIIDDDNDIVGARIAEIRLSSVIFNNGSATKSAND